MQLYFIRHAQSEDNVQLAQNITTATGNLNEISATGNLTGDPELSSTGKKQAEHVSDFMGGEKGAQREKSPGQTGATNPLGITHVYASLMVRSMETAGAIAEALNMTPGIWEDLHETGGIWRPDQASGTLIGQPGNNRSFYEERFPQFQLPDTLGSEGWWNRPLETPSETKERARRFCVELLEKHGNTDDRLVTVGHGMFYSFILNALLKISSDSKTRFILHNTGITRIDFGKGTIRVIYMNHTHHLPGELLTV